MNCIVRGPYYRRRKPAQFEDPKTFLLNYESGLLTKGEIAEGFQVLINSGLVWVIGNGCYTSRANRLIQEGQCRRGKEGGTVKPLRLVKMYTQHQGG